MLACIRDGMGVRNWIVGPVTYGISLPPGEPIRVFHEIATAAGNQIIKDYWVFKNMNPNGEVLDTLHYWRSRPAEIFENFPGICSEMLIL